MKKSKKIKKILIDKLELMALLFFVLGLFLADVNLNTIAAYGLDINVPIIGHIKAPSSSMFWTGFIVSLVAFFIIAIRSMYKRRSHLSISDAIFSAVGIIGLMITLSGGMLLFWHDNSLIIPFFVYDLTRVTYYHIGIALDLVAVLYFALTK